MFANWNATNYLLMVIKWSATLCERTLHLNEVYFKANNIFLVLKSFLFTLLCKVQRTEKKPCCNFTSSPWVISKVFWKNFFVVAFPLYCRSSTLNVYTFLLTFTSQRKLYNVFICWFHSIALSTKQFEMMQKEVTLRKAKHLCFFTSYYLSANSFGFEMSFFIGFFALAALSAFRFCLNLNWKTCWNLTIHFPSILFISRFLLLYFFRFFLFCI